MVKQIKIDENKVVQLCSIGGLLRGGIDVEDIPNEVMRCPAKWIYEGGRFVHNNAYVEPAVPAVEEELTVDDLALAVTELAESTAADKLEVEMAIAELAEVITNG